MYTPYTQCFHCHKWLRLDHEHITAVIDDKKVTIHDEACLRYLKTCEKVSDVAYVNVVVYQD